MGEAILGVSAVVAALIIASYPVIRMIGWCIDGGAEPLVVGMALLLYAALIASIMAGPSIWKIAVLGLILISAIMTPLIGGMADAVQNKSMDDARMHAYAQALERNPLDPVARIALAEELERRGDIDQAIEHLEWTLKEYPRLSIQHQSTLESWIRARDRRGTPDIVVCHMCHAELMPGATMCEQCGALFGARESILQRIRIEGGPKTLIRGWIVTATVLLLALFAVMELPSIVAGPLILASVIAGGALFLRWVGGDLGRVAD